MTRRLKDEPITTSTSRSKLKTRRKPYYRQITPGVFLGFRRNEKGGPWVLKRYVGKGLYKEQIFALAIADDKNEVNIDLDSVGPSTPLTYRQALQVGQRLHLALATGQQTNGPLTVAQVVAEHIEEIHATKKSGAEEESSAECWIYPYIGDLDARTLTTTDLKKWRNMIAASGRRIRTPAGAPPRFGSKPRTAEEKRKRKDTANRVRSILVAALEAAYKDGRLPSNTAWKRLEPFKGVAKSRMSYLTEDEMKRLVLAAEPDFAQMVRAGLLTGGRWGDLCRLNIGDFDAKAKTAKFSSPKTGASYSVFLTDEAVEFFKAVIGDRTRRRDPIFLRADGERWARHHQRRPMQRAVEVAGVDPETTFHTLRHSLASHLVMSGVPLHVVAKALGHSSTRMVELHYSHLAQSYVSDQIRAAAPRLG